MKFRYVFLSAFVVGSSYIFYTLVQGEDNHNEKRGERFSISSENDDKSASPKETPEDAGDKLIKARTLSPSLDPSKRYITQGSSAFTFEDHYTEQIDTFTAFDLKAMSSVMGGYMSDYNGTFHSINIPNYPNILVHVNSKEFFIYGKKYIAKFPFYVKNNKVFGDFESIANHANIDFYYDDKQNLFVSFLERSTFDKNSYVTFLVFYSLKKDLNNSDYISPSKFKNTLKVLQQNYYSFITESDVLGYINDWEDIPDNAIIINFDSTDKSIYTEAYPIAKELNIPITVNLTVSEIGNKGKLNWTQILKMNESGFVTFNTAGYDLGSNSSVFQSESEDLVNYTERLEKDFNLSKSTIEKRLNTPVIAIAYPYGSYNASIDAIAAKYFPLTLTLNHGVEKGAFDPYQIKRIVNNSKDSSSGLINRLNYDEH